MTAAISPLVGALDRGFTRVGRSRIAGKGVFAKKQIPRGCRILEYAGDRLPIGTLLYEIAHGTASDVYAFRLRHDTVIDAARNGNDARFINHSCDPNCEIFIFDDRVYVYAKRDIARGEELTFDYQLGPAIDAQTEPNDPLDHPCRCGSPNCRGTMAAQPAPRSRKATHKRKATTSV